MKQTYLMLAHTFKPGKTHIGGWFLSEKLDGIRAYWDGGLSRGLLAKEVPYANTVKDHRLKHEVIATGLWSRTGKVIYAPDYWLDTLPNIPLDGELYIGPHSFQELTSIVSKKDGSSDWSRIELRVFDSPTFPKMFADRKITVRDYNFKINSAMDFLYYRDIIVDCPDRRCTFERTQNWLKSQLPIVGAVKLLPQMKLPLNYHEAIARIDEVLAQLIAQGSEGVMLRKPSSFWVTERSHLLLKHKPWHDDEATITGYTSGRETDKGSRLLGMIGALIVDYKGKRLELSGLTDEERQFNDGWSQNFAAENPGEDMPESVHAIYFLIGQQITFKYRELSDDGVPKEARYYRKAT